MSDTALVAIVGSVITALSTLAGVYITNRLTYDRLTVQLEYEQARERERFLRERLEELHVLIAEWIIFVAVFHLPITKVMRGEISYNAALDLINEHELTPPNFQRMEMVVELYFPTLRDKYNQLMKARDELSSIVDAHKEQYRIGQTDGSAFRRPFMAAQLAVDARATELKAEIAKLALGGPLVSVEG